ncbi:FtsW/RodA/SpoVE family cell cycle protein [Lederbergia wuyishanensis]|uniref:Probable peptidoglycan glycosyltransferase FtsW n=1 Tax=Lederbergia wuyishanensis TaxID=1347903 RepID=A0ABU0CZE9_9BACI|nr:FtsW/RodA/SpoVE family cell cycle protein [Lederbergia wuyishanensis]MCJ8006136.1 FtsW/RodA/SpoVE family cell cycle protein [Lederbergia wuyishanensis]MDQ0341505.1 cell division protein FtsW [Lederbergia wuyishanensis]
MFKKILKSYDYSIIAVYILLCLFGLVMVYSSSMVRAVQYYEWPADIFYQKQKMNLIFGFIVFLAFAIFPYKAYRNKTFLIIMTGMAVLGLFAVSVIGHTTNNAQSWINVGARKIQPSEFVKLSVIIYLSAVYANKQRYIDNFNKGVFPPIFFLLFVCFLIKIEPDNGTAFITLLIGISIILCSGMSFKSISKLIAICITIGLIFSPFIVMKFDKIFTEGNKGRIVGYLDPFGTYQNEGNQLVNSYLAIGSGGIKGLGLGQSVQKLGYLPEPHTDFIMAIIAEELGVFGVAIVLLGISFLVLRGIYIGIRSRDPFGSMLAIGIASMIGIQSFINLGGVSGLIPITGVTLPFISYGGSSILVLSIAMGILTNVSMFKNYEEKYGNRNNQPQETLRPVQSTIQPKYNIRN